MRRIVPILLFLPALILITGMACGDSTSTETESRTQSRQPATPSDTEAAQIVEVGDYLTATGEAAGAVGGALSNLSSLMANPKIGNTAWSVQVAGEVASIHRAYEQLLELDPPAELAGLHVATLDAVGDCKASVDYFVDWLDSQDLNSMQASIELMDSCNTKTREAQAMLDAYEAGEVIQSTPAASSPPSRSNATVNKGANLRAGPGTDFAVVGGAEQGDAIELVARNETGDWYQLASGEWIAAFLVDNAPPGLPVASTVPSVPQRSAPVAPLAQPAQPYAECDCSGNLFNCSDFVSAYAAQACFNFCGGTANDIHDLDRDGDGNACEWKP